MDLKDMSRNERSLLLYVESCSVDYGGTMEPIRMNAADMKILKRWKKEGFIDTGRIQFAGITAGRSMWVTLSEDAWTLAVKERRARATRMYKRRNREKTSE